MRETTVKHGDGVVFATSGDVIVMVWLSPARIHRATWMMEHVERHVAEHGDVVIVQLILDSSTPPDAETRAAGAQLLERLGERVRCFISVPLGNDLWTLLVRMVVRGTAMWSRTPSLVVSDVDGAVGAVEKHRSPATPPGAFLRPWLTSLLPAAPDAARAA